MKALAFLAFSLSAAHVAHADSHLQSANDDLASELAFESFSLDDTPPPTLAFVEAYGAPVEEQDRNIYDSPSVIRLLETLSSGDSSGTISFVLNSPWTRNPDIDIPPGNRSDLVEAIKQDNSHLIQNFEFEAFANGCDVSGKRDLSAVVDVVCTSEASILALLASELVRDATADDGLIEEFWNGDKLATEVRSATLPSNLNGNSGNRQSSSQEIVVAVIESFDFHDHSGFDDWNGGPSRIVKVKSCSTSTCSPATFTTGTSASSHPVAVASIAAGSITQGQHPSYPGNNANLAQRERSSFAAEPELLLYSIGAAGADTTARGQKLARAIEDAVDEGADVINLSIGVGSAICDVTANYGGLNTTISLATTIGATIVAAAGNDALITQGCSMRYPSLRPQVIAVGSLDTSNGATTLPNTNRLSESSKGPVPMTRNGVSVGDSGIHVIAPGEIDNAYTHSDGFAAFSATSAAAPAVTSGLVQVIEMLSQDWPSVAHNPRHQKSLLALWADRALTFQSNPRQDNETNSFSGWGRFRLYDLDDSAFGSSHETKLGSLTVTSTGVTYINMHPNFPPPSSINQMKATLFFEETGSFSDVADIDLALVTLKPGKFGSPPIVTGILEADDSDRTTKMVNVTGGSNVAVYLRVDVKHLPANRKVYWGYVQHSGSQDEL